MYEIYAKCIPYCFSASGYVKKFCMPRVLHIGLVESPPNVINHYLWANWFVWQGGGGDICLLPIASCLLLIADCLFPIVLAEELTLLARHVAYCLLHMAYTS